MYHKTLSWTARERDGISPFEPPVFAYFLLCWSVWPVMCVCESFVDVCFCWIQPLHRMDLTAWCCVCLASIRLLGLAAPTTDCLQSHGLFSLYINFAEKIWNRVRQEGAFGLIGFPSQRCDWTVELGLRYQISSAVSVAGVSWIRAHFKHPNNYPRRWWFLKTALKLSMVTATCSPLRCGSMDDR